MKENNIPCLEKRIMYSTVSQVTFYGTLVQTIILSESDDNDDDNNDDDNHANCVCSP